MGATYEDKYKLLPSPHQIKLYDKESLLAGKIHAILCRGWNNRVKGRDLYDYIFFLWRLHTAHCSNDRSRLIYDFLKEVNMSR